MISEAYIDELRIDSKQLERDENVVKPIRTYVVTMISLINEGMSPDKEKALVDTFIRDIGGYSDKELALSFIWLGNRYPTIYWWLGESFFILRAEYISRCIDDKGINLDMGFGSKSPR